MDRQQLPGKFQIAAQLEIQASARQVWDVISDFTAVDTWAPQVTKSYALSSDIESVGAQRHCDIKGFGSIDEVITEWIEGQSLTYTVTPLGPLGISYNRWTVSEIGDSLCQVEVEFGYDLRFGLMGSLMHKMMMRHKLESALQQSLAALKTRVETGKLVRPRRSANGEPQLITAAA